jgi:intracellular sulfur oxidation DsrE/DsrF family protein
MSEYKVIFHVDETNKWKLVLTNTRNLMNALQESKLSVEILANSEAVSVLIAKNQSDESLKTFSDLAQTVTFSACNNSLKALGIDPSSLLDFVTVVPSGVAELAIKQHEGYSYIKP